VRSTAGPSAARRRGTAEAWLACQSFAGWLRWRQRSKLERRRRQRLAALDKEMDRAPDAAKAYLLNGRDPFEAVEERQKLLIDSVRREVAATTAPFDAEMEWEALAASTSRLRLDARQDQHGEAGPGAAVASGARDAAASQSVITWGDDDLARMEREVEERARAHASAGQALHEHLSTANLYPGAAARESQQEVDQHRHVPPARQQQGKPRKQDKAAVVTIELDLDSDESAEEPADRRARERQDRVFREIEALRVQSAEWRRLNKPSDRSEGVNLRPQITPADEMAYALAMKGHEDDVLLERFNAKVYRSQIRCMRPGTWLNDEIINQYLFLLQERSALLCKDLAPGQRGQGARLRCYMHNTQFYTKLTEGGTYDYSRVAKWTSRGTRKADLFDKDIVFFPRNIGGAHWTLCVAYMTERRIEYLDSMGAAGSECMADVLRYLADEHADKKKIPLDTSAWTTKSHRRNCPQQHNTNDCGVFLSTFVNHLSVGAKLDFSQSDMEYYRKRIALDVLMGKPACEIPAHC
jgi:sentrin-specific protease 1